MVSVFTRISAMEKRYKDKRNAARIADYFWTVRSAPDIQYKR